IIDSSIRVAIERQPCIVGIGSCPAESIARPVAIEIEIYPLCGIRKRNAIARHVNHDRRAATRVAAQARAGEEIVIASKSHAAAGESEVATGAAAGTTESRSIRREANRTGSIERGCRAGITRGGN